MGGDAPYLYSVGHDCEASASVSSNDGGSKPSRSARSSGGEGAIVNFLCF